MFRKTSLVFLTFALILAACAPAATPAPAPTTVPPTEVVAPAPTDVPAPVAEAPANNLTDGCIAEGQFDPNTDYFPEKIALRYATGFLIEYRGYYKVITISFNFRDNPEKARDKKKNFLRRHSKSHAAHWSYLTTDSATIFRITDAVGFKVKPVGFDFIHPSAIIILSPAGKITRYLYGVTFLPFDFRMAIGEAAKGITQPSINRVLEFCFSYDPDGRRYTLQATRIFGILTLMVALSILLILILTKKKQK